MNLVRNFIYLFLLITFIFSCHPDTPEQGTVRIPVDTIGFAQYAWQMDSIMARIERMYLFEEYHPGDDKTSDPAKIVISPHDDYAYVGPIYPAVIHQIKSPVVIMIGVAHKASLFGLQDKIIFDSYKFWKGPYMNTPISEFRERIIASLDTGMYIVHDSIHAMEHSLEAVLPFLQYYNKRTEIIPILVPYMSFDRMKTISGSLANVIFQLATREKLEWGDDFAILISNDAVHYGDEEWGGNNYAMFGTDSAGYAQAIQHEMNISSCTLCGKLNPDSIRRFNELTVRPDNFKEYKWTWCGRYSVPLGLLTGCKLAELSGIPLYGTMTNYMTSIDHPLLPVDDIGMGTTASASLRHWVGYAGIVYE